MDFYIPMNSDLCVNKDDMIKGLNFLFQVIIVERSFVSEFMCVCVC